MMRRLCAGVTVLTVTLSALLTGSVDGAPAKCNPDAQVEMTVSTADLWGLRQEHPPPQEVPLILLPQPAGQESVWPAALDGSPYGFYSLTSPSNSTKWTIFLQVCAHIVQPCVDVEHSTVLHVEL